MADLQADALQRRAQELREQSIVMAAHAIHVQIHAGLAIAKAEALHLSITSYAEAMRTLGEPAHRAIEHVRTMADEAMSAAARRGTRTALLRDRDAVIDQLVLWAIDAYTA